MTTAFEIRVATKAEFSVALEWAKAEGWNPGLDDLDAFFAADPKGFLMGFLGETPVASISVVKYNDAYGFLGFYIVPPQHRGKGYGLAIWKAGLSYLADCTIGLDGVQDRQDDYRKSGFIWAGRNIRYQGSVTRTIKAQGHFKAERIEDKHFAAVHALDLICFGNNRAAFLKQWVAQLPNQNRMSFVVTIGVQVAGFSTVRKCDQGYKIGPLFALSPAIAATLFEACADSVEVGATLIIDVPKSNIQAVALAEAADLHPVFETARMYRGRVLPLPIATIFGVTTFELG
jgi:Acetyltransferase (GNAT) domain/Acetyltransferase (GNAT) family